MTLKQCLTFYERLMKTMTSTTGDMDRTVEVTVRFAGTEIIVSGKDPRLFVKILRLFYFKH